MKKCLFIRIIYYFRLQIVTLCYTSALILAHSLPLLHTLPSFTYIILYFFVLHYFDTLCKIRLVHALVCCYCWYPYPTDCFVSFDIEFCYLFFPPVTWIGIFRLVSVLISKLPLPLLISWCLFSPNNNIPPNHVTRRFNKRPFSTLLIFIFTCLSSNKLLVCIATHLYLLNSRYETTAILHLYSTWR